LIVYDGIIVDLLLDNGFFEWGLLKEVEYEKKDKVLIGKGTRNQQRYNSSISPPYSQELQYDKPYR
jgi:hypothetical protein